MYEAGLFLIWRFFEDISGCLSSGFNNLLSEIKYNIRRHAFIVSNKPEILISAFLLTHEY